MRKNIEARLSVMFPRASGTTEQYRQLSKLSGVSVEAIRKILNEEQSPTLKNIEAISGAVGLSLSDMFTKDGSYIESKSKDTATQPLAVKPATRPQ
jgi:transcriptional regulator with XRE-family HTH domain